MKQYFSTKSKTPCAACHHSWFLVLAECGRAKGVIGDCKGGTFGPETFKNEVDLRKRGACPDFLGLK